MPRRPDSIGDAFASNARWRRGKKNLPGPLLRSVALVGRGPAVVYRGVHFAGRTFMLRLAPALLLLMPAVALAQEVPTEAERDLWCGTALQQMTRDVPADITPEKQAAADVFAEGGQRLIDRAIPIYLESGYSPEALESFRSRLAAQVNRVVNGVGGGGDDAPYSFQDCSALIGQ